MSLRGYNSEATPDMYRNILSLPGRRTAGTALSIQQICNKKPNVGGGESFTNWDLWIQFSARSKQSSVRKLPLRKSIRIWLDNTSTKGCISRNTRTARKHALDRTRKNFSITYRHFLRTYSAHVNLKYFSPSQVISLLNCFRSSNIGYRDSHSQTVFIV
jgi:hypothetical protein